MTMPDRLRREDGAAAVEFALIVGVLVMLLFGMLQFGLAFFELQNLRAAVREGARAGAVGATTDQVKQRVQDASLNSIPKASSALRVEYTNDASVGSPTWSAPGGTATACPASTATGVTANAAVRARIVLSDAGLPPRLQDIFVVDIPLLPPISLTNATIEGQFRCEGT
jgi:Flp pilus assembly protein TadG